MEVTKDNIFELKDRIKKGNEKLYNFVKDIREYDYPADVLNERWELWQEKYKLLEGLCDQLMAAGYQSCLYIVEGKKTRSCLGGLPGDPEAWCIVCPCRDLPVENQPYYEEAMDDLFKPQRCFSCRSTEFWKRGKEWVCARCHPKPDEEKEDHRNNSLRPV